VPAPATAPGAKPSPQPKPAKGTVASGSNRYLLTIKTKPDVPLGRTFADVVLTTSDARMPRVPIQVILGIRGPVEVAPDRVSFSPGSAVEHVTVTRPDGAPLTIVGVESSDRDFKVTSTPVKAKHEYDVAIRYVGKPGREVKARVTVRTNEPRQRAIVIVLTGKV